MMDTTYEVNANQSADVEDAKSEMSESPTDETIAADEAEFIKDESDSVDYEALIASDLDTLRTEFPELSGIRDITDLNNPLRYAALRDLGLTPEEAYMATAKRKAQDTRAHLRSAHGKSAAASVGMMSQHELASARELFPGMSDSELQRLYKKVTK